MNSIGVAEGLAQQALAWVVCRSASTRAVAMCRAVSLGLATVALLAVGACNLNNPGFDAPKGELAYPIALALSKPEAEGEKSRYLIVANSNFDLRYNGGSVQTYDLDALERALEQENDDNGRCLSPIETSEEAPPVDAGEDAAAPDADASDAELPDDGGALDADAAPDADLLDGGVPDASALDADALDADALDADALEAGEIDGDAALPDASASDAAAVDARIAAISIEAGSPRSESTGRPLLCDGRDEANSKTAACCFNSRSKLDPFRADEISVGSYASGVALSPDSKHVYVTLRGQSRLLHLDLDQDGKLSCGDDKGRCKRGPAYGKKAEVDDGKYPGQPTALLSGNMSALGLVARDGSDDAFVATAHEQGDVSLFRLEEGSGTPKLVYTLPQAAQQRAVSLRLDDGFMLVSSALGNNVARIGARTDLSSKGTYLYRSASIEILDTDLVFTQDVRDALPDSRNDVPGRLPRYYALLRGAGSQVTQAVAFLELDPTTSDGRYAHVIDAVRVANGSSKLLQARVGLRHLLFASCFQDGEIHIIDADKRSTVTVIRDVLGPSDMQLDTARQLLYVTDFSASVIRVVDLRGLFSGAGGVPRVVATLGAPYLPGNVQ